MASLAHELRAPRRHVRPRHVVLLGLTLLVVAGAWWHRAGSPEATLAVGAGASAVAFCPDGALVATGGAEADDGRPTNAVIRLWDLAGRRLVATWVTRGSNVTHLAFEPGGATLTS